MLNKLPQTNYYIGLISGTSLDKIDAALVKISSQQCEAIQADAIEIPQVLRKSIADLCISGDNEIERMAQLDNALGECFADAALGVLKKSGLKQKDITAIGSHGQTIRHQPPIKEHGKIQQGYSVQIANPNIIAERTGITTVADFRRRDMAVNGHGAPLMPAFHQFVFSDATEDCVVLNLGGIANITLLPANQGEVIGFDTGPANGLMDAWAQAQYQQDFDENGSIAANGNIQSNLLNAMLTDDYFSQAAPKSTGREYFNIAWLNAHLKSYASLAKEDVMATLCELTAQTVMDAVKKTAPAAKNIIVCGGGAHNKTLLNCLAKSAGAAVTISSAAQYGVDPDYVEAMGFAWLAHQTIHHQVGNISSVTGAARAVVLGGVYQR